MKISVIVPGRLHGFDMALYFQKKGVLNELITGYPKFIVKKFGIDKKYTRSIYINEIINRTTHFLLNTFPLDYVACEAFDYIASKVMKHDSDVYFIWSSYALRTIRILRKKNPGAKIILVRGSAHIKKHEELLRLVNKLTKPVIKKYIIQKELLEYDETDFITVPSTFAYNSFIEKNIFADKIFLNLLGVDLNEFPFYKKEIKENNELVVGNVGTLSSQKNVASIINVVEKLNRNGKKVKLILAGELDSSFNANLLKKEFIDYKGKLPQSSLHRVYSQLDIFVINSVQEGLAMVQLQAMSCGLPIISTANAGGLDLVKEGENGFTIPVLDNEALEQKIIWFYYNKDKIPEMGKVSRNITENGLTWDDFGKRNINFIHSVLN